MEKKQCITCKETKDIEEFSKNTDYCKDCASIYYQKHKKKQIEKYGKDGYLEKQWETRLIFSAKKEGINVSEFDIQKIAGLTWPMIDYPDKFFPFALSHIDFMKKYDLTVEEYLYIRDQVKKNNSRVF